MMRTNNLRQAMAARKAARGKPRPPGPGRRMAGAWAATTALVVDQRERLRTVFLSGPGPWTVKALAQAAGVHRITATRWLELRWQLGKATWRYPKPEDRPSNGRPPILWYPTSTTTQSQEGA